MGIRTIVAIYVVLLAATVFAVDVLFFRNQSRERLIANIGIVLVFAAFYSKYSNHPQQRAQRANRERLPHLYVLHDVYLVVHTENAAQR